MNAIQNGIAFYGALLAEIAGPAFEVTEYAYADRLPYAWGVKTKIEPLQYIATIELTPKDILSMSEKSDDQKREYLRQEFGHLFRRS